MRTVHDTHSKLQLHFVSIHCACGPSVGRAQNVNGYMNRQAVAKRQFSYTEMALCSCIQTHIHHIFSQLYKL